MTAPLFYLHATYSEGSDTLKEKALTFCVADYRPIHRPSFLLWLFRDTESKAMLCKIRGSSKPADRGMRISVYDAVHIKFIAHGVLNTIWPKAKQDTGMTSKEILDDLMRGRDFFMVGDDQAEFVKNNILKNNPGVIDDSYFLPETESIDTEVRVQATDAIHTALKIFGVRRHAIPPLKEQQIIAFDLETLFSDATKAAVTPDGRHYFEHHGKRLYLHNVDRTAFEEALGVDFM